MSAAPRTDRRGARRVTDSVVRAIAAPLSMFDVSGSYTAHLERTLLAEGKQRLTECLDQALAADVHNHHRAANRALISAFSRMEANHRHWLHDITEGAIDYVGIDPADQAAYRICAHRFVTSCQAVIDRALHTHAAAAQTINRAPLLFEIPITLEALADLYGQSRGLVARAARTKAAVERVCDTLYYLVMRAAHLIGHAFDSEKRTGSDIELGGTDHHKDFTLRLGRDAGRYLAWSSQRKKSDDPNIRVGQWRNDFRKWIDNLAVAQAGDFPKSLDNAMKRALERFQVSGLEEKRTLEPVKEVHMKLAWHLLFPHRPWRDEESGVGRRRSPMELMQIVRLRELATETFRRLDEFDDMKPWSGGRLEHLKRDVLREIFGELIEQSPQPVSLEHIFEIINTRVDPRDRLDEKGLRSILPDLRMMLAGFTHVIKRYEHIYRRDLAESSDPSSARRAATREERNDFGWSRLWPAIWSDETLELWTEREERHGGAPLPVTYRLVFNRAPGSDLLGSVMLVPLFPVQRAFEGDPLRDLVEYMHSGTVAILRSDSAVSRLPYRLAALSAHLVRVLRLGARLVRLAVDVVRYRLWSEGTRPEERDQYEIWDRSVADFVRLGSQRHGPLDRLRAHALRRLPALLSGLVDVALIPKDRLDIVLEPVPFHIWCDAVATMAKGSATTATAVGAALEIRHRSSRQRAITNCVKVLEACSVLATWSADAGPVLDEHIEQIELLEIFLLTSLYYRAARRRPGRPMPRRLDDWLDRADVFVLVAQGRHQAERGEKLRAWVLARLIFAATGDGAAAASTLERLEEALTRASASAIAPGTNARRCPSVDELLFEAMRRSRPSGYITLRDLFWDRIAWPLPASTNER